MTPFAARELSGSATNKFFSTAKDKTMTTRPYSRWTSLLAVPVFTASMLGACQRAGEDTGTGTGSSAGTSGGGTSQSGGGKPSRSERQGPGSHESPGQKSPSR